MKATKSLCILCEKPYTVGPDRRAICPACQAKEGRELLYTIVCRKCGKTFETAIHEFEFRCACGAWQKVQ